MNPTRRYPAARETASRATPGRLRRWLLASAGVMCVCLGAVGVVVPGLPTTVFLIAASWLFAKSCPWLEDRLIRHRLFRPYLRYLDGQTRMPRRVKITSIAIMWIFVGVSATLLLEAGMTVWIPLGVLVAATLGALAIIRQGGRAGSVRPMSFLDVSMGAQAHEASNRPTSRVCSASRSCSSPRPMARVSSDPATKSLSV
ncbi:MAG: DUF454 domain-containing protein [bacterium]|nr:DUF454 domain-containing protein [bacterium]